MQPLDKAFMGPLKTFYCKEIKNCSFQTSGASSSSAILQSIKRAATGEMAANGFRATSLFPCDKNIFRPHDFPLAPQDTEAAPVSHPALVKTSDQPLFSSANFSPFTSAEALLASDIRVPSLNLQPNTRGGTAPPKKKKKRKKKKKKKKQKKKLGGGGLVVVLSLGGGGGGGGLEGTGRSACV